MGEGVVALPPLKIAMSDYCTITQVKSDLPESLLLNSDYDNALSEMVAAASRLIDQAVGRWPNYFLPSTDDETRYYNGSGEQELVIDDCASLTSVAVSATGGVSSSDYTAWSSSDYYTEPYNATGLGQPIRKIVCDYLNGGQDGFYTFRKGVKVVGRFGYSTSVPANVNRCCRIQVTRWHMLAKQGYMDSGASAEIGRIPTDRTLDVDLIRRFLWQYILEHSLA